MGTLILINRDFVSLNEGHNEHLIFVQQEISFIS